MDELNRRIEGTEETISEYREEIGKKWKDSKRPVRLSYMLKPNPQRPGIRRWDLQKAIKYPQEWHLVPL